MGKLVVIKLDGDFQRQEVRVMLEIGLEGDRPWVELPGKLPRSPELSTQLYDWVEKYRNIGEPSRRIKTKKIIYDGGIEKRIEECCQAAEVLSDRFNDWLESPEFRHCDRRLREELSREDEIRVLIRTEDRQLQKLPWHLWDFFDRYVKAELALSPPSVQGVTSLKVPKQKVKILAILGHDEGIKTTVDRQILENLPHAEVKFLVKPPYREINDSLWEENWDILFFAGHSESENERGVIYINEREKLSIAELKYGLRKAVNRGLQLAIFNSCDGLGLAQELAELQIPQTIVMREPVPDRVAHEFLKDFLQAFSKGEPFYLAVREARERLQGLEKEFPCATWLPVICQNPAVKPLTWTELLEKPSELNVVPGINNHSNLSGDRSENMGIMTPSQSTSAGVPKQKWRLVLLLGLCIFAWQVTSPKLATMLNNSAMDSFRAGQLSESVKKIQWAIVFDSSNAAVYYNGGWICEQVQDFDCARSRYQEAAKHGSAAAYSQLAFIALKVDGDYAAALDFIGDGFKVARDDRVKYSLHKNLGWARLEQGRYAEALEHLQTAIELNSNGAAAYCLLAQVQERLADIPEAIAQWKVCMELADTLKSEEDRWLEMARERLSSVNPDRDQGVKGNKN